MNVAELIAELDALRPELAGYLVAKGVSASETEGLASLVDKVASISAGSGGIIPTGTLDIVRNGSVDVAAYAMANVNVPTSEIALQEKSVTPSAVVQTVVADEGYDGLSEVEVGAIPEEYAVLPTFTKTPATAPHILSGYQAVNNKNELVTGNMTKWSGTSWYTSTLGIQSIKQGYHDGSTKYGISTTEAAKIIPENIKSGVTILGVTGTVGSSIQSGSKTVTEDDVEEGTYTKFTVTATGSTVDLAVAWICSVGSTRARLYTALIVDGTVVKSDVGDYHMNSISISGNKISFSIADDEVLDYSDYTVYWKIVSH